ncbi:MAG: T9SS type A sorting domain-containing protein [Flavobacteriales bacterium]|nr:T9SS type A sorting domain-containing protein [Flavobacteriales bacterium]
MKRSLLFVAVMLLGMSNAFGQDDYALSFNGTDQRLKYSNDENLDKINGATDYTIEVWVKPTSDDIHNNVVVKRWYQFAITLYKDDLKKLYFTHYGTPTDDGSGTITQKNTYINSLENVIKINEWNHIAVINNSTSNEIKLFVNGVDVTDKHYDAIPLISNPDEGHATYSPNMFIANGGSGTNLAAEMDDFRILDIAKDISELETSSVLNSNYTADSNTIVLMKMDEGSGTVMTIDEANNTEVMLNNDPLWVNLSESLSTPKNNTTKFGIFPNPSANGFVTIQTQNNESLTSIEVFNTLGKSVRSISVDQQSKVSFDVNGLNQGIYFVRATTKGGVATQKLVIK